MKITVLKKAEAPTPSSPVATGKSGLKYKYYEGDIRQVSDISKQKVKKQGTLSNFSLSPMQRKYYFGFEYEGYIKIEKAGEYTFYSISDDGSALWIGNTKVVNNDGLHGYRERSGKITLAAGLHPIKVAFFEHAGGEILQIKYAGPWLRQEISSQ